jgi:hypothetical protein
MIRYRNALENIAALAHVDRHSSLSWNEALWRFAMIKQWANKALYSPGQPRSMDRIAQVPKFKPRARSQRARSQK